MRKTTRQIILNLLQSRGGWQPLWSIVNTNTECGFLPVAARTRAQELAQEGKIEHTLGSKDDPNVPGKYSWYRTKLIEYQTFNIRDSFGNVYKTIKLPKVEKKLQTNLLLKY